MVMDLVVARAAARRDPQEQERSHDDQNDASDRAGYSDRLPGTARGTRASPVRIVRLHNRLAAAVARWRRGPGHDVRHTARGPNWSMPVAWLSASRQLRVRAPGVLAAGILRWERCGCEPGSPFLRQQRL